MTAGIGAALGLLFASWASRLLIRLLSTRTNTVFLDVSLDGRILLFTAFVATVTAALFGIVPALRASRVDPMDALKEHGRAGSAHSTLRAANGLVVLQVALSIVLVVAAGLFLRTFVSLESRPLGFDADRVLVANLNGVRAGADDQIRRAIFERARDEVARVPGVATVSLSMVTRRRTTPSRESRTLARLERDAQRRSHRRGGQHLCGAVGPVDAVWPRTARPRDPRRGGGRVAECQHVGRMVPGVASVSNRSG